MYPQVLPAIRPRSLHRLRIDNILDLRAHARLNNLRQCFGRRDVLEVERAGERGKRRQPARKWRPREQGGRASRDRLKARGSAATVSVTDDENCDGERDGFSKNVCERDEGTQRGRRGEERDALCSTPIGPTAYVITESTLSSSGWTWLYVCICASKPRKCKSWKTRRRAYLAMFR